MAIEAWVQRLESRFRGLAEARPDWPIFALEHGIRGTDLQVFMVEMGDLIPARTLRNEHRLAWVAYAAEFGYEFRGVDFWKRFEKSTKGWKTAYQPWLRETFESFARDFHGVTPRSEWAKTYNRIAWPVVHGLVPKDLQRILVEYLFTARPPKEAFESATTLGRYLHSASASESSRFQELAENEALLGQVAAALLMPSVGERLVAPETLSRIVEDIRKERAAAAWLEEARERVGKLNLRGLGRREPANGQPSGVQPAGQTSAIEIPLAASFELRQGVDEAWMLWANIPSLAPIAAAAPELRDFLATARPRWRSDGGRMLARGTLIHGVGQQVAAWPEPGALLVEVEAAPDKVASAISRFKFPVAKRLLFQIREPYLATQVPTNQVRPGRDYLLVQGHSENTPGGAFRSLPSACNGARVLAISIPENVTVEVLQVLEAVGLTATRSLRVRPVGPQPAVWDDQGNCEYLEEDAMVLAIQTAGLRGTLHIEGDEVSPTQLERRGTDAENVIVKIGPLPRGIYRYEFRFVAEDAKEAIGYLRVLVRPRGSTGRTRGTCSGVVVYTSPERPSLEALWQGRAEIALAGAPGHEVNTSLELLDEEGDCLGRRAWNLCPPTDPEGWARSWSAITADQRLAACLPAASSGVLVFDAGDYGYQKIVLRREARALRWRLLSGEHTALLRLINDSDNEEDVRVSHIPFKCPLTMTDVSALGWEATAISPPEPGMYLARAGELRATALYATDQRAAALVSDERPARLPPLAGSKDRLAAALEILGLWDEGEVLGAIEVAKLRQRAVDDLEGAWFEAVCGEPWRAGEKSYQKGELTAADLAQLIVPEKPIHAVVDALLRYATVAPSLASGQRMEALIASLRDALPDEAKGIVQTIQLRPGMRRHRDHTRSICQAAFLASSEPSLLLPRGQVGMLDLCDRLLLAPRMTRAVRWVVLTCVGQGVKPRDWAWA